MELPERWFAVGHEPKGLRVTGYGATSGITAILEALMPSERETVERSCFGKFLCLASEPAFSGRFGRFMMSRMLKTQRKHEIWFLFAGKPVRFSLREFAIITGLPCGQFPVKSRKRLKNNITETPYWPSLFGKLESVSVDMVIRMLKHKTITDTDQRIKLAYLAILSSVLLPSSHGHKIIKEYAELMKDMSVFFAFPWGRLAFNMIISSVTERNEITLSQRTIAITGFVHAIQLVMVAAVPSLLEVPTTTIFHDEELEEDQLEDGNDEVTKSQLKNSHTEKLHKDPQTVVCSIIPMDVDVVVNEEELCYSDEVEDLKVVHMLELINQDHEFTNQMFVGGATGADVALMNKEAEEKAKEKTKPKKSDVVDLTEGHTSPNVDNESLDAQLVADLVVRKFSTTMKRLEVSVKENSKQLLELRSDLTNLKAEIREDVSAEVKMIKTEVCAAIIEFLEKAEKAQSDRYQTVDRNTDTTNPVNPIPSPILDKGLEDVSQQGNSSGNIVPNEVNLDSPRGIDTFIGSVLSNLRAAEVSTDANVGVNGGSSSQVGDNTVASTEVSHGTEDGSQSPDDQMDVDDEIRMPVQVEPPAQPEQAEEDDQQGEDDHQGEGDQEDEGDLEDEDDQEDEVELRQSKRQRQIPAKLGGDFHCDIQMLHRVREAHLVSVGKGHEEDYVRKYDILMKKFKKLKSLTINGWPILSTEFFDIVTRAKTATAKVVDILLEHVRSLLCSEETQFYKKMDFFDTQFATLLMKSKAKFKRLSDKNEHAFQKPLVELFTGENAKNIDAERFYFPYHFDNIHWVGICVDAVASTLYILGCDHALRKDSVIAKDLSVVAQMLPYLLKKVGRAQSSKDPKPFAIVRPKVIPQNGRHADSALTSVLLMEAHAMDGVEVCRCITQEILDFEVKRISVLLYEANYAPL